MDHAAPSAVDDAAALIIGNEILSGKIADANLVVLARTLRGLGIALRRAVTVSDELPIIRDEVRRLAAAHDVVFTSGGVGPTHDDVTVEAVAAAFDVPLESCAQLEHLIRGFYGDKVTDSHLRVARVPRGGRLVSGPDSPWPALVMNNVWMLPGIPQLFAMKMASVRANLRGSSSFVLARVYTTTEEGALKPLLDAVVAAHPNVEVGSYPQWRNPRYRTLVTFDGPSRASVEAAQQSFVRQLEPGSHVSGE